MKDQDEEDTDLDISWINEQEKIQNIDKNYFREVMESIDVHIIYINMNFYIENIIREKVVLTIKDKKSILEKERMLQLIQSKKKSTPFSKYKFLDAILYNIDLEPEQIQQYANSEPNKETTFLKSIKILEDVSISPSIFVFHGMNGIYLLFKEEAKTDISNIKGKSILKYDDQPAKKITKRVRLILNKNRSTTKKQKPVKNMDIPNTNDE